MFLRGAFLFSRADGLTRACRCRVPRKLPVPRGCRSFGSFADEAKFHFAADERLQLIHDVVSEVEDDHDDLEVSISVSGPI